MTSKFCCGFNFHEPLLENLCVTARLPFLPAKKFTGHSKGNFFDIARSASAALGEVGKRGWIRDHVSLLE